MNHSHPQQPSPVPQHMPSSSKPTAGAPKLPHNVCQADVKPRLTKEQHDILETHFKAQPKPTTNTKKGFADTLGVPLDKINNWFQNRRAKVKQDKKKHFNQINMSMGYYQPQQMSVPSSHFAPHGEQHQAHLVIPHDYYPATAEVSPASLPVQSVEGPSALDLGPQMMHQQPYDNFHYMRSIPEADRSAAYHPDVMQHSLMAATAGASYMQENPATLPRQDSTFNYEGAQLHGLPHDSPYSMQPPLATGSAPSHAPFEFSGLGVDFSTFTGNADNVNELRHSAGSISEGASPFSGAQSTPSSHGPDPVAAITSVYSNWKGTDEPTGSDDTCKPAMGSTDGVFGSPYNMQHASMSDASLYNSWGQNGPNQAFVPGDMYQHSNASAHAVLSSPHQNERNNSTGPVDLEIPIYSDGNFARRTSSTSNLANNIEAIDIKNSTPDHLIHPDHASTIATRRHRQPTALNRNTLRSSSYNSRMPSPGNADHDLRRIRSSGIAPPAGRVHKTNPASAQRSPNTMTFTEAASSPKFARTLSECSGTTVGQGGNPAPLTPQTPNETARFPYWQSNTVLRSYTAMPDHSSPDSLNASWSYEPQSAGIYSNRASPSSTNLELGQAQLSREELYHDSPPQSAPATQQSFPRTFMQPPQIRAGYHSSTDLTIAQPKPSHYRRPSLPDPGQGQTDESNTMYNNFTFDDYGDISLNGISHNVPFAPPVSAMPDLPVHQYWPPQGSFMRRPTEPQAKNFIFANQGPSDFRP